MIFVIMVTSSSLCAQTIGRQSAETSEAAGWKAFKADRLDLAEAQFVRSLNGGNIEAYRGLAEVCRRRDDFEGASNHFRALLSKYPSDSAIKKDLASTLASLPSHRLEAIELYTQLLIDDPHDHQLAIDKAHVLAWSGQYDEATDLFKAVGKAPVKSAMKRKAMIGLADTLAWSGQHHRAVDLYRKVLVYSRQPAALRGLADVELWHGRPVVAGRLYHNSRESEPDHVTAIRGLRQAEEATRDTLFGQGQYFTDSADWQRWKGLATYQWVHSDEITLNLGLESAFYRDRSGDHARRVAAVANGVWRFDTFARLEGDLAIGTVTGSKETLTGGIGIVSQLTDHLEVRAHYRHDHFIDDTSAFSYRPYNSAFTVAILEKDPLDADKFVWGGVWDFADKWQLQVETSYTSLEDHNRRWDLYSSAEREIHKDDAVTVHVRSWYYRSDFGSTSTRYFAPSSLETYGVGARLNALFAKGQSHLDVGVFYQPSGVNEFGYQVAAGLDWTINDRWSWGMSIDHMNTAERGSGRYKTINGRVFLTIRF